MSTDASTAGEPPATTDAFDDSHLRARCGRRHRGGSQKTARIHTRGQRFAERIRHTLATTASTARVLSAADVPGLSAFFTRVTERGTRRLDTGAWVVPPTATVLVVLIGMTGLAAASAPTPTPTPVAAGAGAGGVCPTPAVDLFEWAARTGAGVLFLGGLLYGGYKHARAMLTPDPERASHHRRTGTMSMLAGPMFGLAIVFGKQAAGVAGFNVAQCAQLLPWF